MNVEPRIDQVAGALADQTRTAIVCMMMDGRAYTAKELAHGAGVTPQTTTFHLNILKDCGLIVALKSGRCIYHRIAGPAVAEVVEALANLSSAEHLTRIGPGNVPGGAGAGVLVARSCYNHLAGRLGVLLADGLIERSLVECSGGNLCVSRSGAAFFRDLGIETDRLPRHRPLVRCCLDWTERRYHLAGSLATALFEASLERGWLRRQKTGRGLDISESGYRYFGDALGLTHEFIHTGQTGVQRWA